MPYTSYVIKHYIPAKQKIFINFIFPLPQSGSELVEYKNAIFISSFSTSSMVLKKKLVNA